MSDPRGVSPIVRLTCRVVACIVQVFACYVVFHGHYSPGGGFQGGALLAAAIIMLRISQNPEDSGRELPPSMTMPIGAAGVLIFVGVGVVNMFSGGSFLEYGATSLGSLSPASVHYWSILLVEVGIALAVMAILVAIFDELMDRSDHA